MVDHRLADLQTQWIGKHVTITNSPVAVRTGTVVAIGLSGRKLTRLGYPYWIDLDSGLEMPWRPDTDIQETVRG